MLITDYNMPLINGYELVRMLRYNARFQDLVIIGLSAEGDSSLSAKFIKSGANDFLKKPFYHEEFHCRVIHNLEAQEMLQTIRDMSNLDSLTGLYSRRYLFSEGESYYRKVIQKQKQASVALIDVDDFKQVNEGYGHLIGDVVLEALGKDIVNAFSGQLACRFGGEEFCIVSDLSVQELKTRLEDFLEQLKNKAYTEAKLSISCSVGVAGGMPFEEAIQAVSVNVAKAKLLGGNQVLD